MFKVAIRCSRPTLFFNLILFARLANCGFWRRAVDSVMAPSEQADPGEVLPFVGLPPSNPTFFANQSIQPSSSSSSSLPCEATCILQASVSRDPDQYFLQCPNMEFSQSLYTIGLKNPQTQLVSPPFLAHHCLPFLLDSTRNITDRLTWRLQDTDPSQVSLLAHTSFSSPSPSVKSAAQS